MKRKVILGAVAVLFLFALALTLVVFWALRSDKPTDIELVLNATKVGTPKGEKVVKDIDASGGVLVAADGRLTVTVPENAVKERTAFSIQPISNEMPNGIGLGYRIENEGKTLAVPAMLSLHYDDNDLRGTIPEVLAFGYQDAEGAWHVKMHTKLDSAGKTVSFSTTHFSGWGIFPYYQMEPVEATVYVGESETIKISFCEQWWQVPGRIGWNLTPWKIRSGRTNLDRCEDATLDDADWTVIGEGTISQASRTDPAVIYTAPSRKPSPNIAYVKLKMLVVIRDPDTGELTRKVREFSTKITILDRAFKASGSDGPASYSGTICDLERPFTVNLTHPIFGAAPLKFTPTSRTAGTASWSGAGLGIRGNAGASYTVEGLDTDSPRIRLRVQATATAPVVTTSGGGLGTVILTPVRDASEGCTN